MATPNLDKELLKLRIRLGDTYTSGGSLFTTSTSNLNLDGSAITSAELVDIYNFAVREFIRLMSSGIPAKRWGYLIPGYIVAAPAVSIETTATADNFPADYIKLSSFTPAIHSIIELRGSTDTPLVNKIGHNIGVYYPPNLIQEMMTDSNDSFKNQVMYTILNTLLDDVSENMIVITPQSAAPSTAVYSIVYLKSHADFVQSTGTDLSTTDIPMSTLDTILALAEREYISRRQFDEFGINSQRINETLKIIGG